MRNRWFMVVVVVLCSILVMPVVASAEGWLSNLNPFGESKDESDSGGWALPSKSSASKPAPSRSKAEPTTWQKISSGTSSAAKTTSSYINPWHKENKPAKPSGSRGYKTASSKSKSSGSTWYNPASWFAGEQPAEKKPQTVSSFLGQSRPK